MNRDTFERYCARKRAEYGDRFDPSALAPEFIPYFESGERIKVQFNWGRSEHAKFGTVGVTTGWCPVFILMARCTDYGSSRVLRSDDQIVAVKRGSRYVNL